MTANGVIVNEILKGSFQVGRIVQTEAITPQLLLVCGLGPGTCLQALPTLTRSWPNQRTCLESCSREYFPPKPVLSGVVSLHSTQQTETVAMSVICSQNQSGDKAFGYLDRVMAASVRSMSLELRSILFHFRYVRHSQHCAGRFTEPIQGRAPHSP